MNILSDLDKYEPLSMHHHQLPVIWKKAENAFVWDINNKKYIDFTSGIFVTNTGHSLVNKAIINQARKGLIFSYTFPTRERLALSKKLIDMTPEFCEKVFFLSSGTEATECAVKLMRMYSKSEDSERKFIVSMTGAMHGKTELAEQLKGNYEWAEPNPNIYHLSFPNADARFREEIIHCPGQIAGFIIESYRGWDAKFMPVNYIRELVHWAKSKDIPVCFDEIQGGFGRTGKLFAYEHYGVEPDLICVGKGLGGGVPISGVLGRAKYIDLANDLSSTFSGNPLCCAAALENLNYLTHKNLVDISKTKGWFMHYELQRLVNSYPIERVQGYGMLAALIMDDEQRASDLCYLAASQGLLLVKTGRESVKIGPPITIPLPALKIGLKILRQCLAELEKERPHKRDFTVW